ncbi:Type I restriction-modification system, specificity subunit S [Pseudomonas chlororaphis subsp. aurantiaca]|uniref:restriction endonuclease subunit S n=1 Tax=Pseudomonas chlororaphis TaxID=587753 RepID=UPI000F6CE37F|nr:restriction endonuclease subunit S [Pseudomonas chlororaphis]AZD54280.1 Type I restriction-modification system, specificity subunit S [Pseudomonas chlororaphis subsp. aurantiaca]
MTPLATQHTMKNSGVAWLGNIPKHWQLKRYKHIFRERDQRSLHGHETLLSVSAYTGVSPRSGLIEDGELEHRASSLVGYKICRAGDLVMNIMLAWNRAQGISRFDGIVSPAYSVFEVIDDSDLRFLDYLVRANTTAAYFKTWSYGIIESRLRLYPETFGSLFCAIPSRIEQSKIADYLDRATFRIDSLVAKKTHFINLLRKKRQALIMHSVTRGLDPSIPMKDSGVEWLGKVPAHWDVVPPGALFTESKERARDGDQILSATQKYGVIPLIDFETLEQRQVTKATANFEMRKHVEIGDFVISMRSMDGGLERARAVGSVRSSYTVLRTGPDVEGRYFGALLKSDLYIQALRLTSNFIRDGQDLSFSHVRKVKLPKPGVEEQAAIADYIETATSRIDTLITKTERSIELLREHRTALITAAVTGRIDLRSNA